MQQPWHHSWPKDVPRTLEYPNISLFQMLERSRDRNPTAPSITFYGKTLTYDALHAQVVSFSGALASRGIGPGDRVALHLPNVPHFPIAFFACLRLGAIAVPTNPLYTPRELSRQFADAGVRVVVSLDLLFHNLGPVCEEGQIDHVILCDVADFLPSPLRWLYPLKKRKLQRAAIPKTSLITPYRETFGSEAPASPAPVDPRTHPAVIQYTGGTTGVPRGAVLTHRNLLANAMQTLHWIPHWAESELRFLAALPYFHLYGLTTAMLAPILAGAEILLLPDPRDVHGVLKLIHKRRPTFFPGVPAMFQAIASRPDLFRYDLRSLRACISGAAPLPVELKRKFEAVTEGHLVEGYGLTEASPVTHCNPLFEPGRDGIGLPFPDTEAKIVDQGSGEGDLAPGEVGELAVRGPQVMQGYWKHPEENALVLRDGWLLTGDIASMDSDGFFRILDRKKDLILVSGYNVYPREVEEALLEHPQVQEAAVIGVSDGQGGERIKAFLVGKAGASLNDEALAAFCRSRLAPFKVPKEYAFVKELPKTIIGKVLRRELRAL